MIRAIVIDDEIQSRVALIDALQSLSTSIIVVAEASSVITGVEVIDLHQPDVVFLDIQLGDGSGFNIIDKVKYSQFKIVFTTAYNQYALQAFGVNAIDYLLKPIVQADLKLALDKVLQITLNTQANKIQYLLNDLNAKNNKICFSTTEGFSVHFIKDIIRCESDNNYSRIFFTNHDQLYLSKTLKQLEDQLIEFGFERIHKSHLININHLQKYLNKDGGGAIMSDGTMVPVSQRKKAELATILNRMSNPY